MIITLDKIQALETLYENKDNHANEYEKAIKGWEAIIGEYTVLLKKWASGNGKQGERPSEPPKPRDYMTEYDDLIRKLEHHRLITIEVDDLEFDQIINNKFNWSNNFTLSNSAYIGK